MRLFVRENIEQAIIFEFIMLFFLSFIDSCFLSLILVQSDSANDVFVDNNWTGVYSQDVYDKTGNFILFCLQFEKCIFSLMYIWKACVILLLICRLLYGQWIKQQDSDYDFSVYLFRRRDKRPHVQFAKFSTFLLEDLDLSLI